MDVQSCIRSYTLQCQSRHKEGCAPATFGTLVPVGALVSVVGAISSPKPAWRGGRLDESVGGTAEGSCLPGNFSTRTRRAVSGLSTRRSPPKTCCRRHDGGRRLVKPGAARPRCYPASALPVVEHALRSAGSRARPTGRPAGQRRLLRGAGSVLRAAGAAFVHSRRNPRRQACMPSWKLFALEPLLDPLVVDGGLCGVDAPGRRCGPVRGRRRPITLVRPQKTGFTASAAGTVRAADVTVLSRV